VRIDLVVNGVARNVDADPITPLVTVLRDHLELRGTKVGCGNGECGACAVLIDGRAMCSCLLPVQRATGKAITTIEGLAAEGRLNTLQQAFIDHGALQCGFCTPGMIMSAQALLLRTPRPSEAEVVEALAGNICRCTGYRQIIAAVVDAGQRGRQQ
jgi:aerobic-type carbon monoxide dehydrogenase small subunit (CoxS/CutS family)